MEAVIGRDWHRALPNMESGRQNNPPVCFGAFPDLRARCSSRAGKAIYAIGGASLWATPHLAAKRTSYSDVTVSTDRLMQWLKRGRHVFCHAVKADTLSAKTR